MTSETLFYIFSALILLSALWVVFSRNAVNSLLFVIVTFIGTAGLFILLESYFLAALQILVYAGAVMVLFLFVIMLINVDHPVEKYFDKFSFFISLFVLLILSSGSGFLFNNYFKSFNIPEIGLVSSLPTAEAPLAYTTASKSFGYALFSKYVLPFEIAGIILLIAIMGIIVLSKSPVRKNIDSTSRPF